MVKLPCDFNDPMLQRALAWLHDKHGHSTVGDTINLFKSEFNGYLFVDNDWSWESIMFANDQDATMFVMRFS